MRAKVYSSSLLGIDAYTVEVEVDLARGLPRFNIVGLPDVAVKEASADNEDSLSRTHCNIYRGVV